MNIESIKRKLLVKYPLFGSVVANSNFIAEPTLKTAGTDGKNIYYNPNFIESITDDQQSFVFAHEICHIAFNHISRSEGKDTELWNIATDSVINALLKKDGLPIVKGGVDIPEAINYDAEEMYKKLLENKKRKQQNGAQDNNKQPNNSENQQGQQNQENINNNQDSQNQENYNKNNNQESQNQKHNSNSTSNSELNDSKEKQDENNDIGHDTHSMWQKALEKKHKEEQSQSAPEHSQSAPEQFSDKNKNKPSFIDKLIKIGKKKEQHDNQQQPNESKKNEQYDNKQQPNESQKNERENKMMEEIKKITELGEREVFKLNKIERKKQLEGLREALVSHSLGHGSDTTSEKIDITDIGASKPLIDWRMLLKEAVKHEIDWSYQNAEIEDGVVTAYLEEIPQPETEIVLDTSGSIDEILLRNFLRECKNILQTSKVKVGCFDTKFYGFTEIRNTSDIDNLKFYGGGGTDFDVAVNAFTRRVENKIIFTDGCAAMPSTPIDTIWIVFGGMEINPEGGKVIYINDAQLEGLYNYEIDNEKSGKLK